MLADRYPQLLSGGQRQRIALGPNTRLEFRRNDDESLVNVELSREAWTALRGRLGLRPGSAAHLKPRRITRFQEVADDPAAAI